ncbi:MAG TPA: hypothetical protein VN873_12485 [Candidatus Angelobacter sp.]|nr:hypothetical protein [Candidatus Angelobacter sp.]
MIPIKIQCGCGQKYAFEVEPVNGQMAAAIACPVCGADGTTDANQMIAQTLGAQPNVAPASGLRLSVAPSAAAPAARPPIPPMGAARPAMGAALASTSLAWYEQLWIALPIGLVAVGGVIGGACGGAAWGINKTVFKKFENPILKYLVTGLISASAVVVWLVVAAFFLSMFKKH